MGWDLTNLHEWSFTRQDRDGARQYEVRQDHIGRR